MALKNAGYIIIGLTNLSSTVGEQTQSPYVIGGINPKDKWMGHSFENALKSKMTHEEYESGLRQLRQSFRDAIERCFQATNATVIMASGESFLTSIASGAGYPIASVPLGFSSYNGRPHGLEILERNGEEAKILQVMSAWEATFPEARKPPPQLVY
ncbi:hypothetical protein GGS24DRAFT_506135 [Hypoxylon argillaceum]|nr:hypothetical protein GGS24DRAFT_506135 [Hypoxylon argillaceum]